jgi:hypothetical protein
MDGDRPGRGGVSSSIVGTISRLESPRSQNDYGSQILPIFPIYDMAGNLVTEQPLTISVSDSSITISSIQDSAWGNHNARYEYDSARQQLTVHFIGVFYRDDSNSGKVEPKFTKYQKAEVYDVPESSWNLAHKSTKEAVAEAAEYIEFMKAEDQTDAYGNEIHIEYPRLLVSVFELLWSESIPNAFTSKTAIVSPNSEEVVGSLVATFSGGIENDWGRRVGDYSEITALSPAEIEELVREVEEECKWPSVLDVTRSAFPVTGTENVRALNLAVRSGD